MAKPATHDRLGPRRGADHGAHPARDQGGQLPPGGALHLHLRLEVAGLYRLPPDHLLSRARGPRSASWRPRRSAAMSATRRIEAVAGGETAGIPFAAWIADRMMAPMAYVRKKPKGFGRNALIEGDVPEGKRTLLVEDLTTDGAVQDPVRPGAARRRRDRQPRLRRVLLRRVPRQLRDAGQDGHHAAPPVHLVGRAGGLPRPALFRRERRSPRCGASWRTRSPGRPRMAASRQRRGSRGAQGRCRLITVPTDRQPARAGSGIHTQLAGLVLEFVPKVIDRGKS